MEVIQRYYAVRRAEDGAFYTKKRTTDFREARESTEDSFSYENKPRIYNRIGDARATANKFAKARFNHWVRENEKPIKVRRYTYYSSNDTWEIKDYRETWTKEEEEHFKGMYHVVQIVAVVLEEGETLDGNPLLKK